MLKRKYQVFISSTYKDLKEEREEVMKAILRDYNFPVGMELFHADNEEQWTQIANTIDTSDYYVLILGHCCGTVIQNERKSYTEKEYDYAMSKGIPVLAFVIDDDAPVKYYEETVAQQKIYKRFKKKVEKLPREIWKNKEDLALKVSSTLNLKISENNRKGWIQYNSNGLYSDIEISDNIVGEYTLIYTTAKKGKGERLIYSIMNIEKDGNVILKNNINNCNNGDAEFIYHGTCIAEEKILNINMKNDFSNERLNIELMASVGNLKRYIGLLLGLSPEGIPSCVKVACVKNDIKEKINIELLNELLKNKNETYTENALGIEAKDTEIFFSNKLFTKNQN